MKYPCYGCTKRFPCCHAYCECYREMSEKVHKFEKDIKDAEWAETMRNVKSKQRYIEHIRRDRHSYIYH